MDEVRVTDSFVTQAYTIRVAINTEKYRNVFGNFGFEKKPMVTLTLIAIY